jgi:hypothetical protein
MPTYNVIHKKTKKVKQLFMSISEMLEWEKAHPNYEVLCGSPLIHSGGGLGNLKSTKPDEGFKDKIREIAKKSPGNTLGNYVKF